MTAARNAIRPAIPRPDLFLCGLLSVLGAVAAIAGDVITVRPNDDLTFVASTLSDAAAGPESLWMDLGMTGQGIALAACAVGLWRWRGGGLRFRAGCGMLALTGALLITIAWRNAYGAGEPALFVIHEPLVAVMGVGFTAALILLARTLGELDSGYHRFSFMALAVWIVAWPVFIVAPEAVRGAVERLAGFTLIIWLAIAGRILMRCGRGERLDRGAL